MHCPLVANQKTRWSIHCLTIQQCCVEHPWPPLNSIQTMFAAQKLCKYEIKFCCCTRTTFSNIILNYVTIVMPGSFIQEATGKQLFNKNCPALLRQAAQNVAKLAKLFRYSTSFGFFSSDIVYWNIHLNVHMLGTPLRLDTSEIFDSVCKITIANHPI